MKFMSQQYGIGPAARRCQGSFVFYGVFAVPCRPAGSEKTSYVHLVEMWACIITLALLFGPFFWIWIESSLADIIISLDTISAPACCPLSTSLATISSILWPNLETHHVYFKISQHCHTKTFQQQQPITNTHFISSVCSHPLTIFSCLPVDRHRYT